MDKLLKDVCLEIKRAQKVTEGHLMCLDTCFGHDLENALKLIDKYCVTRYKIEGLTDASIYIVSGSATTSHLTFINPNYCTCAAFSRRSASLEPIGMCKHIVACSIYEALDKPTVSMGQSGVIRILTQYLPICKPNLIKDTRGLDEILDVINRDSLFGKEDKTTVAADTTITHAYSGDSTIMNDK